MSRSIIVRTMTVGAAALGVVGAATLFTVVRREVTPPRPETISAVPPAPLAFARSTDRLTTIDTERAEVAVSVQGGVSSPDGSRLFRTAPSATGDGQRLSVIEPRTGDEIWSRPIRRGFDLRVASYDGSIVALLPPASGPAYGYPEGRTSTPVLIVPTAGGPARLHRLEGTFEPEAFSRDGQDLFLIEYVPAAAPTGYLVRRLDLSSGRVAPVDSPDIGPRDVMGGTATAQVMSPDGARLYTLYSVPAGAVDGLHGTDPTHGRAFVHVLDLDEKWAHCLLLPDPFGVEFTAQGPLALSPDGTDLFVLDPDRDGGRGNLIQVDTTTLAPGDAHLGAAPPWPAAAAVGDDGALYVSGTSASGSGRMEVIDTATMATVDSWGLRLAPSSVDVTADGLLLVQPDRDRLLLVAPDGSRRRAIEVPGSPLLFVGPGSVSLPGPREVLECAC